jgi:DNA-binding beta-propeller fold protein YncE
MRKLALLSALVGFGAAITAVVAAVGASQSVSAIPGASGTIWAVERFDTGPNTLAALDASTGQVLGVVQIGKRPIGVTSPKGSHKVYTADERSNQLTVVSKDDFSIVKQIPMGAFPHHLMAGPNGNHVYVGEYGTNKVGVVDATTDTLAAEWTASANPLAKTHAVWITNDGKDLYATNEGATQAAIGTLSKLDATSGERLWEVPIGARPSEVLVTPDRKTAYVTIRNENRLKVLDVSGDAPAGPTGDVVVGGQPDTMQITGDGQTLVVGLRSVPQMALVDTETLAVRHVTFQGYGISGHQWLSPNGRFTFIALESAVTTQPGAIGVVDNGSGEILATWEYPGGPFPHGVFYEPQVLR